MDPIKEIFSSGGLRKKYSEISRTLQAYEVAVNEVAIVSVTDLAGKILYVNEKFTEISQYGADELIGKTHKIINSGYHPPEFFKQMWQTIRAGHPWRGEIKNKAKDGSYYWVDTVITPVRDEQDQIFQYLSIRNLITAQKEHEEELLQYQQALLRRKQQLKDAQAVAKTGSWHRVFPGNHIEWSEETYRIFGIPFNQPVTYETFLAAVHPDDRRAVDECWQQALKNGRYEIEHRIMTPAGEKWVMERARMEFDSSSTFIRALGTVQDITDKKKTEDTLQESEALYKNLFNNSPSAIGILEKDSLQFLEVNEKASKLYGYSREEFLQMTGYDIRKSDERQKMVDQYLSGNYINDFSPREHSKKNGEVIWVEPSISEITYKDREALLITINDVTEKLRIERELAEATVNRQKEINRAMLEAQEKSRAEIGRELHDNINQLLIASTLFIKKTKAASPADEQLLNTGADIIGKAMEEIRKLSSHFVPPSLKDLSLKDSIDYLSHSFRLAGTVFNVDIHLEEAIMPEALKVNLYRIVQEQLSNILKHAEASQVKLSMIQGERILSLDISDNGKGFDTNRKTNGIGLTNIHQRAEAYNGKVNIESSPGKGCLLHISFVLDH